MAACGIAPEDDDGNAGSKSPKVGEATLRAILADIGACTNEAELKNAYFDAIKAVGNDAAAKEHVINAKDARKASL